MPIKVPVVQTGLEASIQAAAKKAGKAMKIDMGAGAKSIEGLSQPLVGITGKADQFTKSMEAANARVLAFVLPWGFCLRSREVSKNSLKLP